MTELPEDRCDGADEPTTEVSPGARVRPDVDWALVAQVHYDAADRDGLTVAIVEAIAEAEGVPPTAILDPPLYESVDAVALESTLFDTDGGADAAPDAGSVEFMYRQYRVVVRRDGWVLVHEEAES